MAKCKKCMRILTHDEIALYKRMVNRGASEFLCLTCFSEYFGASEEVLKEKIEMFKEAGCSLF